MRTLETAMHLSSSWTDRTSAVASSLPLWAPSWLSSGTGFTLVSELEKSVALVYLSLHLQNFQSSSRSGHSMVWPDIRLMGISVTTMLEPYRRLAAGPQSAEASILIPRATTAFTGLWQAVVLRDIFGGAVAFAGVLSMFTPSFLANIPYKLTLTWTTYRVCTWLSVAILVIMILVLIGSGIVKWPSLPVEPSTIAGCMYYVSFSVLLFVFVGVLSLSLLV